MRAYKVINYVDFTGNNLDAVESVLKEASTQVKNIEIKRVTVDKREVSLPEWKNNSLDVSVLTIEYTNNEGKEVTRDLPLPILYKHATIGDIIFFEDNELKVLPNDEFLKKFLKKEVVETSVELEISQTKCSCCPYKMGYQPYNFPNNPYQYTPPQYYFSNNKTTGDKRYEVVCESNCSK